MTGNDYFSKKFKILSPVWKLIHLLMVLARLNFKIDFMCLVVKERGAMVQDKLAEFKAAV